ncbi:MAG: response regulator [Fusobacteriota bacterium]
MKNILIVEDSYIYLKVLKNIFSEDTGYNIFISRSVKDSIDLVNREKVDIILLDTKLPDGDGKSLIKHIRKEQKEMFTYILLITSEVNENYISEFYKLGIDLYMSKPINPNILKFTVKRLSERINNANIYLNNE